MIEMLLSMLPNYRKNAVVQNCSLLNPYTMTEGNGEIIIYQLEDESPRIEVTLEDESIWLTQAQIVEVFGSSKANISEHIKHIYAAGEVAREGTVRKFRTVAKEGKRLVNRELEHYNLVMILYIGYRVNSIRGTQFRIWANKVL